MEISEKKELLHNILELISSLRDGIEGDSKHTILYFKLYDIEKYAMNSISAWMYILISSKITHLTN